MSSRPKNSGFTLVELAIALVITGIFVTSAIQGYRIWQAKLMYDTTEQRLKAVKKSIDLFIRNNRYLPCPASRTDPADGSASPNSVYGTATDCTMAAGAIPGVADVTATNLNPNTGLPHEIRIGAVPVRNLGLPDEYMSDAWGRRFTYMATKALTDPPVIGDTTIGYRYNTGAISFIDSAGNSLISPPDLVMYAVISHGPDGNGAYVGSSGVPYMPCDTTHADGENCDDDKDVTFTSNYAQTDLGLHFDDLLVHEIRDFVALSSIKHYSVIPFACTDNPALPAATPTGMRCATSFFSGADLYIDPGAGENPSDGVLFYEQDFVSQTNGRLVMRAVIPVDVDNAMTGPNWRSAINAAVYIDDAPVAETVLLDPAGDSTEAEGFSNLIIAGSAAGFLVEGTSYNVKIYLYSFGNNLVSSKSGWAGTLKHSYHNGMSYAEFMEIEDF